MKAFIKMPIEIMKTRPECCDRKCPHKRTTYCGQFSTYLTRNAKNDMIRCQQCLDAEVKEDGK